MGKTDLLVNNAALGMYRVNPKFVVEPKPFYEVETDGFKDMVDTNFMGYFLVAKGFAPLIIAQGKGFIVNLSTGERRCRHQVLLLMDGLTCGFRSTIKIMTEELRKYEITANLILPGGAVDTNLFAVQTMTAVSAEHGFS